MSAALRLAPGLREQYLCSIHGLINVGWLVLMHMGLLAWLWWGQALVSLPWCLAISIGVCLTHQRLLSEWFHEATHWNLLPGRRLNDFVTDVLIGTFNGTRVSANRPGHFRHHAVSAFFRPDDPDTAALSATTRTELWRGIGRDLLGLTALTAFFRAAGRGRSPTTVVTVVAWYAWLAVVHGAGLMASVAAGRYLAYPLYFLTLLTLYPLANRIRLYGQHAEMSPEGRMRLSGSTTSRTFHSGLLGQLLLNSPMIMYHHEHHAAPALPYRALRAIAQASDDPNVAGTSSVAVALAVASDLP